MAINPDVNVSEIKNIFLTNSSIFQNLPPELVAKLNGLIIIVKAIGIIFILYLVFLIVKSIFGIRRNMRINKTYYKVNEISDKLDILLKNRGMKKIKKEILEKSSEDKLKPKK
jgi:hypothetical protein